jgi:hypothetical protein
VGGINHHGIGRGFGNFVDEGDATILEVFDDVAVVDDFVEDVDGGPFELQYFIDHLDGHFDAGAEASGVGEKDLHLR